MFAMHLSTRSLCCEQEAVHWRVHKRNTLHCAVAHLSQRRLLADFLAWRHRAALLMSRYLLTRQHRPV